MTQQQKPAHIFDAAVGLTDWRKCCSKSLAPFMMHRVTEQVILLFLISHTAPLSSVKGN